MSNEKRRILINVVIAILIGGGLFLGIFSLFLLSAAPPELESASPLVVTIAKPTQTATFLPTGIPHEQSEESITDPSGIMLGAVVQIYNTEGAGLRLRSNPGISSAVQFIGEELELFAVVNGPTEQDGHLWWYLESPYDENRSGWAAAEYLQLIEEAD